MRTKIAVVGEDVSKSLSPAIHKAAFKALKLPFSYEAVSISPQHFNDFFLRAEENFLGLNITIPFKEKCVEFVEQLSDAAKKLQAVNTILFSETASMGDNTDIAGCMAPVRAFHWPMEHSPVFILGAGGAAKATVEAIFSLGARHFIVVSRSLKRLKSFQAWFQSHYPKANLKVLELNALAHEHDPKAVFVNAAPLEAIQGIPAFDSIQFSKASLVIEWVYRPRETPWIAKAKKGKAAFVEGYKILLHQGMKGFEWWTNMPAPESVMEKALLEKLA